MLLSLIASGLTLEPVFPNARPAVGSCLVRQWFEGSGRSLWCNSVTVPVILEKLNELNGSDVRLAGPCTLVYSGGFPFGRGDHPDSLMLVFGPSLQMVAPSLYRCASSRPTPEEVAAWKLRLAEDRG